MLRRCKDWVCAKLDSGGRSAVWPWPGADVPQVTMTMHGMAAIASVLLEDIGFSRVSDP